MKINKRGFTLIELIIIVAIIGILASIALPSYCDYIGRSKVAKGLNALSTAKLYLEELAIAKKPLPIKNDTTVLSLVNDEMIESVSWHPEERSLLVALSTKATNATRDNGKYFVLTMKTTAEAVHSQCSNQHPLITEKAVHNNDLPPSCRS